MNEYPNSIRNNMVNTEPYRDRYKIDIESLPEPNMNYSVQRESSHKFRNAVIAVAIAASALGYVGAVTYIQHQNMLKSTEVVATEALPGGATLKVTENPNYSYITTPEGFDVAEYNGIDAQELARGYSQNTNSMGR